MVRSLIENPLLKKYDFKEEYDEETDGNWRYTGYPEPIKRYRIVYESFNNSIEESYFWILEHLGDLGAPQFEKIIDLIAGSEMSSFSGTNKQRLALTQDRVAQYIRGVSEVSKELFARVREIRWIDERLELYRDSNNLKSKSRHSSERTLKSIWIELVEGGAKNPNSVYGLAREVGFMTLPDLFLGAPYLEEDKIDEYVDKLEFNNKVKDALAKKLKMYYRWKIETFKELQQRRKFVLKLIRQSYNTINLYINWLKPYLNTVKRLLPSEKYLDSAEMATAFEGSFIELEFLAKTMPSGNRKYFGVVLVNLQYRTRPAMSYTSPDYQQRGPIHVGKVEINWRTYTWTQDDIDRYKKMREEENFKAIADIDKSLKSTLDELDEEVKKYLKEAGEQLDDENNEDKNDDKEKDNKKSNDIISTFIIGPLDPFISIFKGINEMTKTLLKFADAFKDPKKKEQEKEKSMDKNEQKKAKGPAMFQAWTCYKNYKKSHGMLAW